jgi:hypothetical protein
VCTILTSLSPVPRAATDQVTSIPVVIPRTWR